MKVILNNPLDQRTKYDGTKYIWNEVYSKVYDFSPRPSDDLKYINNCCDITEL